jgi:uncharacterized membrane protein HdeD (DUF308 family)
MDYPTVYEALARRQQRILWTGLALVGIGILALIFPIATTWITQIYMGIVLVLTGAVSFYISRSLNEELSVFGAKLWSLMNVLAGGFLIFNHGVGAIIVTALVAISFALQGIYEILLAAALRKRAIWIWLLASGLISIALAIFIASGLPESSNVVLGILVGVNFVSSGVALLFLKRHLSRRLSA